MDSNPLDGLIAEATRDYPAEGNDVLMEWWAQEYGPRLLAALKAGNKVCREHRASVVASTIRSAMSAAAEVPHGK